MNINQPTFSCIGDEIILKQCKTKIKQIYASANKGHIRKQNYQCQFVTVENYLKTYG